MLKAYQIAWNGTARFYCAYDRNRAAILASDDIARVCDIGMLSVLSGVKCMRAPLLDDEADAQGYEGMLTPVSNR